uniref:protein-tyrosine-phosphatase n=1 Tax=Strix occidentalis caurina TaxID=311401 RepID=A0A8D0KR65_STROC
IHPAPSLAIVLLLQGGPRGFGFASAGTLLNLNVSAHGRSDSLLLSWDEPEGGAEGYSLALSSLRSGTPLQNGSAGPNITSFWFHGLTPGMRYEIEVTATLPCMETTSQTVTAQTSPSPVRNLSLSSGGSSAVLHASWAHALGQRDGYHLALYHSESQTLVRNASILPNASTFLFDGLLAGSEYALKVSTLAGSGQASTSIHQWTDPLAPAGVTLTNTRRPLGLSAFWDKAAGDVDQFHLQLYSKNHPAQRNISVGPNTHNFTFLGLSPGIQYFLKVTVLAGPYRSSSHFPHAEVQAVFWLLQLLSPTISWISMLCFPLDPLSLANVSVQPGRRPQELHVSWVESGGGRDHLVQLSVAESLSIIRNVSIPRGVTQLDLEGLVPGSRYRVEIISQAGPHRTSSQTAIGYTGRNTSPLQPSPSLVPSLTLTWRGTPPGQRDGYLLSIHEEGSSAPARSMEAGKDSTNVTLAGLEPGTCYLVRIWAVAGPYRSLPKNVTGCTVPAAPTNVSLTNPDSSSELYMSWNKPAGRRDHYRVNLYSLSTQSRDQVQTLSPDAQNITWTHLEAGSRFAVQVTAVKGSFEASSTNVTQWTRESDGLGWTHPSASMLQASWAAVGRGAEGYLVDVYDTASTSLGRDTHNFTFMGLTPGYEYSLEASATAGPYQAAAPNISGWTRECLEECLLQRGGSVSPLGSPEEGWEAPRSQMSSSFRACHISFTEPNPVEDVQCLPESRSLYLNWTSSPGDVEAYEVVTERLSDGPAASKYVMSIPTSKASLEGLGPNSSYRITVSTVGMNAMRSQAVTLLCNTTVEALPPPLRADIFQVEASSTVIISSDLFSEENGQIEYYGVVATTNDSLLRPTQEIMSSTWYDHYYGTEDSYLAVLIPNPFHPSPRSSTETWRVPVGTEECGQSRATSAGSGNILIILKSLLTFKQCSVGPTSLGNDVGYKPSLCVCIQVLQVSRLGCLIGHLTGLPDLPIAKASFPLDFISCRNVHRPIPIQNFKQYYEMKTASANHAFFQEFEELKEVGKEQPKVEAELPANVSKNRYPHVLPYDHSRVKLSKLGEDPHSDYINANFMPGYTSQQEFIATQGPLKKTIEDFWRLVWEQNVCNIIMLTVCMENGRVLCDHYWPSESAPVSYGQVRVHLLMQSSSEEWTMREFKLWHGLQAERHVSHLHYTAWPDHGIPESTTSIMTFRELVREHIQSTKDAGPTLVHCSAGVGRTGTFIALDRLLQQMKQEKVVDTFGVVYALRMNRYLMIQTLSQYIFLHSCILEKILEEPLLSLSQTESGGVSQMGTVISLDCLLHQMKAERIVDVYGVTLQLTRSCCLMTPTLVGGKEKGWWSRQKRTFMLSCLELVACCPLTGCYLPPGSLSSLCRDLFHASSPSCSSSSYQGLRAQSFSREQLSVSLVLELKWVKLHVSS